MSNKIKIKEVFASIQGEGPFVGYKQLFVRFCGCNLSCNYCDTDYRTVDSQEYSVEEIVEIIKNNTDCHSKVIRHKPKKNILYIDNYICCIHN